MTEERAIQLRNIISGAMQNVDDSVAAENALLFPDWQEDTPYVTGYKVRHDGILYKVLQTHTSQSTWIPEESPSLFAKVLIPDETSIPEWEQPDSTNPYMIGDKVVYKGAIYESLIDNNVWSPEGYPNGWKIV